MAEIADIVRGNSRDVNVAVVDSDGNAFDVTTFTDIKMYVKKHLTDTSYTMEITGSVVNGAAGTITLPMETTDTDVDKGSYNYSIVITDGTDLYTVKISTFQIVNDVK